LKSFYKIKSSIILIAKSHRMTKFICKYTSDYLGIHTTKVAKK